MMGTEIACGGLRERLPRDRDSLALSMQKAGIFQPGDRRYANERFVIVAQYVRCFWHSSVFV